jgi:hypothetical protein
MFQAALPLLDGGNRRDESTFENSSIIRDHPDVEAATVYPRSPIAPRQIDHFFDPDPRRAGRHGPLPSRRALASFRAIDFVPSYRHRNQDVTPRITRRW